MKNQKWLCQLLVHTVIGRTPALQALILSITVQTRDWENPVPVFQLPGKNTSTYIFICLTRSLRKFYSKADTIFARYSPLRPLFSLGKAERKAEEHVLKDPEFMAILLSHHFSSHLGCAKLFHSNYHGSRRIISYMAAGKTAYV